MQGESVKGSAERFVVGECAQLIAQDKGDHEPTAPTLAAYTAACRDLTSVQVQWAQAADSGLAAFNAVLTR